MAVKVVTNGTIEGGRIGRMVGEFGRVDLKTDDAANMAGLGGLGLTTTSRTR